MRVIKQLFILFAFIYFCELEAQNNKVPSYGQNSILYNGELYNYSISHRIKGHQFFQTRDFKKGNICIKNKIFEDVLLNYDIYQQQILLKFKYHNVDKIISIPKEIVKEFSFNNNHFTILNNGWNFKIYEVIGDGEIKILRHWRKELKLSSGNESKDYTFTKAFIIRYLYKKGELIRFQSKRSFISEFPEDSQPLISKFLRSNQINLKRALKDELSALTNYCNNLEN